MEWNKRLKGTAASNTGLLRTFWSRKNGTTCSENSRRLSFFCAAHQILPNALPTALEYMVHWLPHPKNIRTYRLSELNKRFCWLLYYQFIAATGATGRLARVYALIFGGWSLNFYQTVCFGLATLSLPSRVGRACAALSRCQSCARHWHCSGPRVVLNEFYLEYCVRGHRTNNSAFLLSCGA